MILTDSEAAEARGALAETVEAMLAKVSPTADVVLRADAAAGGTIDRVLWERLNAELGAAGLAVPEAWGGSDASLAEVAVVAEALGRHLSTVPLLGTWLTLSALVSSGDESLAPRVAQMLETGAAAAVVLDPAVVRARRTESGWTLDGVADLVIDAAHADFLLVPATDANLLGWFLVAAADVAVTARETLDLTRSLAQVEFTGAAADRVAVDDASALLDELLDVAAVLVASEQLGVAEKSVGDAVAYAAIREQFGRPIGSFQALKHILADMATQADLARSLVEHAVWAAVESPEQLRAAAASALLESSRAACAVTAENVQVHGGIGFSWEHPAHLYFRKARSNEMLLGEAWADRSFAALAAEPTRSA